MTDPSLLPPGTLLAGKFRIERVLGSGAMGVVYAVHHELTRHRRALKLLHPDAREVPDLVRRFLNEASAAGRAGNPHLVETFDAGTLPTGEPYVVMELLEGRTLRAMLAAERVISPALAAEIVAQTAEGMDSAHRAGIVHRDLKPDNVFIVTVDGRPFVKILDFGVSKFVTASAAQLPTSLAGALFGSPAYMSPEQISGQAGVDERADVFALGIVLYEALTGVRPFDAPTLEALAVRLLTGELTPIESVRPDIPPGLAATVKRALAPLREERTPTARALAADLAPFRLPAAPSGAEHARPSGTPASLPPSGMGSVSPTGLPGARGSRWLLVALIAAVPFAAGATWVAGRRLRAVADARSSDGVMPPTAHENSISRVPAPALAQRGLDRVDASSAAASGATTAVASRSATASGATPAPLLWRGPNGPDAASTAQSMGLSEDNPFRR